MLIESGDATAGISLADHNTTNFDTVLFQASGNNAFFKSGNNIDFYPNGTRYVRFNSSGLVGIGSGINVPDAMLHVAGTTLVEKTDTEALLVRKDADGGDILTVDTTNSDVEVKQFKFVDGGSTVDIIRDEDDMTSDDAAALATQQSIKKYVDDNAGSPSATTVFYETIEYTGDGTTSQVIELVDTELTPFEVEIYMQSADGGFSWRCYSTNIIIDDDADGGAIFLTTSVQNFEDNKIIAFAKGSFTVDDGGGGNHPNKGAQVYNARVLGTH